MSSGNRRFRRTIRRRTKVVRGNKCIQSGKDIFHRRSSAKAKAATLRRKDNKPWSYYKCEHCRYFHLTSGG